MQLTGRPSGLVAPAGAAAGAQQRPARVVPRLTTARTSAARRPERSCKADCGRASRRASRLVVAAAAAKADEYVVVRESLPGSKAKLTITVPGSLCQKAFARTVETLKRDVVGPLKGFRDGKVPLSMVVSRVGGQANFKAAVLEEVLLSSMADVMPQYASRQVPDSERITTPAKAMVDAFDPAQPLVFEVEYEVLPEVRWSRPYQDISVTVQDTGNLSTDTAAAQDLVRQYLKERAQQRVVAGRGLQMGDVAIVSMHICPVGSSAPFPGLSKDGFVFDTEADPLGMAPHMLGMTPGEERSWEFTFADDWHVELWRGQRAAAKVGLQELFSWVLPEFDDDFVSKHYPSFESAAAMKQALVTTTALQRLKAMEEAVQDRLVEQVAACVDMEVPPAFMQQVGVREYEARILQMIQRGVATPADAERLMSDAAVAEFMEEKGAELEERCKWLLAADAIFEEQGLKLDEEAVAAEVERAREGLAADGMDKVDPAAVRADVEEKAKLATVMGWLQEHCKVEMLPWAGGGGGASAEAEGAAAGAAAPQGAAA